MTTTCLRICVTFLRPLPNADLGCCPHPVGLLPQMASPAPSRSLARATGHPRCSVGKPLRIIAVGVGVLRSLLGDCMMMGILSLLPAAAAPRTDSATPSKGSRAARATQPMTDAPAPVKPVPATCSRSLRRAALLHAGSMTALLIVLIATIFVVPVIAPAEKTGEVFRDVSFTLILLSGAAAVAEFRVRSYIAMALCAIAIVLRWSEWLVPLNTVLPVRQGAGLLAVALLIVIVGVRVFAGGFVSADRIMGAVVLYLMLGLTWAIGYEIVSIHVTDAFAGGKVSDAGPDQWVYFSFVTLTTVGYGDITPVARAARSLAALEALVGQLYPAIILARLVSLHSGSPTAGHP